LPHPGKHGELRALREAPVGDDQTELRAEIVATVRRFVER